MRILIFVYWFALAAVCVGILMLLYLIITLLFPEHVLNSHTPFAGCAGFSLAATAALRPQIRKIVGINKCIQNKMQKFHKKYPIESDSLPFEILKAGDRISLHGYGDCIYNGKFLKKHIIIVPSQKNKPEECLNVTSDDLINTCQKVWCKEGVKWICPQ